MKLNKLRLKLYRESVELLQKILDSFTALFSYWQINAFSKFTMEFYFCSKRYFCFSSFMVLLKVSILNYFLRSAVNVKISENWTVRE